ncbi:MAG: PD-(D/E)XK nuclease family protein [Pseudonocardiaceae bacterium]
MTMLPDVTTHSMLSRFGRCPRAAMYAYYDKLRPRSIRRPLRMGVWFHYLLEAHYSGNDWRAVHEKLTLQHEDSFFDEEVGDIPNSCERLMRSYLWHYQLEKKYGWKILDVEVKLVAVWPDGSEYWCRFDLLVEDANGDIWIVDHKLRTRMPGVYMYLLESQNLAYIWAAWKNKIKVKGFIWNVVRMKPPVIPRVLKNNTLSKRKIMTDYPTLAKVIRDNEMDPRDYADDLRRLKAVYWRPDKTQESPFFFRHALDADPEIIRRKIKEMYKTRKRMARYNFEDRDAVERVVDRTCETHCDYTLLCSTELIGGNADNVRRLNYREVDPLDHYKLHS